MPVPHSLPAVPGMLNSLTAQYAVTLRALVRPGYLAGDRTWLAGISKNSETPEQSCQNCTREPSAGTCAPSFLPHH